MRTLTYFSPGVGKPSNVIIVPVWCNNIIQNIAIEREYHVNRSGHFSYVCAKDKTCILNQWKTIQ